MKTKPTILVAFMPNTKDWQIANEQNWYRIPKDKVPKIISENSAKYIAFYFPAVFGKNKKWKVTHYAKINSITEVIRKELFPNEMINPKSNKIYYKIGFEKIEALSITFGSILKHKKSSDT